MMSSRPAGEDLGSSPNIIEGGFFQQLLHLETQKAVRLRYSIAVLCVAVANTEHGENPALTKYVADTIIRRLRATDSATMLSPSIVGILLVDTKIESVPQVFERATETL